jgi:hypothetical protein
LYGVERWSRVAAMFTKLTTWITRVRRRRHERIAEDYGSLTDDERREVDRLRTEHRGYGDLSPDRDLGNRPGT